jgi:hypothetical protein
MHDCRLPPRRIWELRTSGVLRSVEWWFVTDVSGQPIESISKGQEMQIFDYFFQLEDGTDTLSRNVGKEFLSTLRNAPEERRSQGFYRLQLVCGPHRVWEFSWVFVHTAVWCARDTPISSSVFRLLAQSPRVTVAADWRNGISTTTS